MENLKDKLTSIRALKIVKDFGITEVFRNGDVIHITSDYDIPEKERDFIEREAFARSVDKLTPAEHKKRIAEIKQGIFSYRDQNTRNEIKKYTGAG